MLPLSSKYWNHSHICCSNCPLLWDIILFSSSGWSTTPNLPASAYWVLRWQVCAILPSQILNKCNDLFDISTQWSGRYGKNPYIISGTIMLMWPRDQTVVRYKSKQTFILRLFLPSVTCETVMVSNEGKQFRVKFKKRSGRIWTQQMWDSLWVHWKGCRAAHSIVFRSLFRSLRQNPM